MTEIEGGVCAPKGFRASGVHAGIKTKNTSRKDCALIVSDSEAAIAGTFTTNKFKAPPVQWSEGVCIRGAGRAVFINSGNANAATGGQGVRDAQATAERLALGLDVPITEVCVLSTGVIGVPLPMDRITRGVEGCMDTLTPLGGADAARAIMTTDTVPKEYALEVPLSSGTVRIGGIAKGSGMIAPNMATMIAILTTDAKMEAEALKALLKECVDRSFNCICVDNDMSTSDAVICLANGQAGGDTLEPGTPDYVAFAAALAQMCSQLAQELVRDGEGATKFIEIAVTGAANDAEARNIARSIAQSMLVKTAFAGEDANWGRIACAAGYADASFQQERFSLSIAGLEVVHEGLPTIYEEADAAARMKQNDIRLDVSVGEGAGVCLFWTSDLTHDYISINADYRS